MRAANIYVWHPMAHPFRRLRSGTELRDELDRRLDRVVGASFRQTPPGTLYHYTSWRGAEGILRNQLFWATAHDCTNDPAELKTADEIVLRVAENLKHELTGVCSDLLRLLIEGLPKTNVATVARIYLACFSAARDKPSQWTKYGDNGAGVCLAFPTLSEPPPKDGFDRAIVRVRYGEPEVEAAVERSIRLVCEELNRSLRQGVPRDNDTALHPLNALYRISGIAALAAKKPAWAAEEEWRIAAVVKPAADNPLKRTRDDGQEVSYIELPLRDRGRHLELAEIIVGPNQDEQEGRARAAALLERCGYSTTGSTGTAISISAAPKPAAS